MKRASARSKPAELFSHPSAVISPDRQQVNNVHGTDSCSAESMTEMNSKEKMIVTFVIK